MLLEVRASLGDEVGVKAPVAEASLVFNSGPFCLIHLCPSGRVCGVVLILPHVQAPSVLTSGVQHLAEAALVVGGATGIDLVLLGLPSVAGKILHVVLAGIGPLCPTADLRPAL